MNLRIDHAVAAIAALLCSMSANAAPDKNFCSELSTYLISKRKPNLADPSRMPTAAEQRLISDSNVELLEMADYGSGVLIVDADNDGKEDVSAWNIQGIARNVVAGLFEFPPQSADNSEKLVSRGQLYLGDLQDPYFVRFNDINYIVSTATGDDDGLFVSQVSKKTSRGHELHILCRSRTILTPETQCKHPACKRLKALVDNVQENQPFVTVEWPHKYFPPAGLEVYFSELWSKADFDNTNRSATIWRIGRREYIFEHIYWMLLGQGLTTPRVDPQLRPQLLDSPSADDRRILPGVEHGRLRRAIARQSKTFSRQFHRPVDLVTEAEFFLFKAKASRTYWAWDFGTPPLGEEIHISYTAPKRSAYLGVVRIKRSQILEPCTSGCIDPIDL